MAVKEHIKQTYRTIVILSIILKWVFVIYFNRAFHQSTKILLKELVAICLSWIQILSIVLENYSLSRLTGLQTVYST